MTAIQLELPLESPLTSSALYDLIAAFSINSYRRPDVIKITRSRYEQLVQSFPPGTLVHGRRLSEPMFDGIRLEIID